MTLPLLPDGWRHFLGFAGYDYIAEMDRELRYFDVSANYERLLGRTREELLGRTALELGLIHPEDIDELREGLRPLFEGGTPVRVEYRFRVAGGAWAWAESSGQAFLNSAGVWRCVFISRDISVRKEMEASLAASEADYRSLIEHAVDAILIGNARGEIMRANARAFELTGYGPDDLLGMNFAALFSADEHKRAPLRYDLLDRGEDVRSERLVTRRDRTTVPVEMNTRKLPDGRYQTFMRDITERRRVERALRQTQKLESLGVLAGGIAHDFNNLLTAILGNLNLAQLFVAPESRAHPYLGAVEKIVLKAAELTRQMLAYSGKGSFVVRSHDLNQVVQEMTHLLEVSISKKVSLRLRLDPNIVPIDADVAQIQQVILNLVTNASDAVGDAEGAISISTRVMDLDDAYIAGTFASQKLSPGRYVAMEVSDTGSGIPAEIMDRIFDPFFTTKAAGRGLGLSAMLGILRGHGAGYKIYSERGRGTTFKLLFPASVKPQARAPETPEQELSPLHGTVLLVDDEETLLETLPPALEHFGLHVLTARDGREAVDLYRRDPSAVDVVLMDVTMPRMDGREAFWEVRKLRADARVILSSGYHEESVESLRNEGLADFIQKPYQLSELRRVLARVLAR
jgi:PAS domain S-box-containing protein